MKYYLIAGEASGDLHGSNLMAAISELDPEARFRCWGGERMQARGGVLVKHFRDMNYMGFLEVLKNIRSILRLMRHCKKDLLEYQPDALILIDYPGFNLRMARFAKQHGMKTIYYISPQLWAWRQSRVRIVKGFVDRMLVILPFEKDFYKKFGVDVSFTGHPLLDEIGMESVTGADVFKEKYNLPDKPIVAILPGSRPMEISYMLETMVAAARDFPDHHFVIAGLSLHGRDVYETAADISGISLLFDQTYQLLKHARAAMVTSGTATLETAIMGVPQVVCYRGSPISYLFVRRVIKVPYISLVNLIMDKPVVRELIQSQVNKEVLTSELKKLLVDHAYHEQMQKDYLELRTKLGGSGASRRAATAILNELKG